MKKILLKLGLGCLLVGAVSACNDDFLERYPLDRITNATFWNTENDLMVYNNSIYDLVRVEPNVPILQGHNNGFDSHFGSIWNQDELSDNMAPVEPRHTFFQQIRSGKYTVPSNPDWCGYHRKAARQLGRRRRSRPGHALGGSAGQGPDLSF